MFQMKVAEIAGGETRAGGGQGSCTECRREGTASASQETSLN
jgi:hypothetical protein